MVSVGEKIYQREVDRLREIVVDPLWYENFQKQEKARLVGASILRTGSANEGFYENLKNGVYDAFEQLLAEEVVALGTDGYNWDSERQPIDTIVIHHTSRKPGLTTDRLNAMHLIRLYVPHYQNPPESDLEYVKGRPIYSGHFRDGRQKFWAYHWLVRKDGQAERLLQDDQTGWQAGNWGVNCRSIAICIDDDLMNVKPSGDVMAGIADVIQSNYANLDISPTTLLGHGEVNKRTQCPGTEFLGGWKAELLDRVESS